MREMRETLRATFSRFLKLENRRRVVRNGTLEHIAAFKSAILGNERRITIYLPPGYADRGSGVSPDASGVPPLARYPVLYMQDGQNLFEPERAFIPGMHWCLREAADEAIGARTAEPAIIVGIDNTGPQRVDEYTPTRDLEKKVGGRADDYARMLFEELKPLIDARYRTLADRTLLGGSSLGALLTMYLGLEHADVFESLAVMSPSVWWDSRRILDIVNDFAGPRRPRIWLDIGGREGKAALDDVRTLRDRLIAKGWRNGETLRYFEDRRADHSERAWAKRARPMLEFLLAPAP